MERGFGHGTQPGRGNGRQPVTGVDRAQHGGPGEAPAHVTVDDDLAAQSAARRSRTTVARAIDDRWVSSSQQAASYGETKFTGRNPGRAACSAPITGSRRPTPVQRSSVDIEREDPGDLVESARARRGRHRRAPRRGLAGRPIARRHRQAAPAHHRARTTGAGGRRRPPARRRAGALARPANWAAVARSNGPTGRSVVVAQAVRLASAVGVMVPRCTEKPVSRRPVRPEGPRHPSPMVRPSRWRAEPHLSHSGAPHGLGTTTPTPPTGLGTTW